MSWYLADLVLRVTGDDGRAGVEISTCLVEARDADEAYDKALALGRDAEGQFVGLHDLVAIAEPLADGAELAWQARPEADATRLVAPKEALGVFGARPPATGLAPPRVAGIHHAQIMIPPGGEDEARRFYGELLGLTELPKPPALAARGGVWFSLGAQQLHLGVEAPGVDRRATRAHVAYEVTRLASLRARLAAAGFSVVDGEPVDGLRRCELRDPFGNRVELLERGP